MRAPLSWLRDFAPFGDDAGALAATLTDLGLVVEEVVHVGQGLEGVVVARAEEITAIPGADRIRRVVVDAGGPQPLEIVCGAFNFTVGDLLPLAPVGTVLPGGFEIGRRKMKGVVSHGMLCSGKELGLSDDGEGLLVLTGVDGARPGQPVTEALGIERDVVFDITVEGNRPDAWCMAGIARDLAARLGLPFAIPEPPDPSAGAGGPAVASLASLVLESPALCPRITVRVLTGVTVGPSPRWLARRLELAGMRPINNVVDASNYVMLELGQPTHPYDQARLAGPGLVVRRARPGETVETLDGVVRTTGVGGPAVGDTGEDCLICDAEGTPVGIGGVMGGASSEISDGTTGVLLEAAYFTPMVVARTSRRLGLRTEASARFERGCDPWGIDRAAARFCQLVRLTSSAAVVAPGVLDERGDVPQPVHLALPVERVNRQLGLELDTTAVAALLVPLGFGCEPGDGGTLAVTVPTNRPDVRPAPYGVDDVIEEVARSYGYSRLPRRRLSWPEPGAMTDRQRERRRVREVLCGVGCSEAWTPTFVAQADHERMGLAGSAVEVANPLAHEERFLRRALLPGLLRAVAYNADRRQGPIRLFEVGTVFSHPEVGAARLVERAGAGGRSAQALPGERELLATVLAADEDDARTAVALWMTLREELRLKDVALVAPPPGAGTGQPELDGASADEALAGLHPTRCARLVATGPDGRATAIGSVGEVDPEVASRFGAPATRLGWLLLDLGLVADPTAVARRSEDAVPVSRFPSSDVDVALVVGDEVPASAVAAVLEAAGGELLESVELFDVYRGPAVGEGVRSLAFRLRFCALDHTLTDAEVGELRAACIGAAERQAGAVLR